MRTTLEQLAKNLLEALGRSLHLVSFDIEDEDPSFVVIHLDEASSVNSFDDEDERSVECDKIKNELNKNSLRLFDEYSERYIDYKLARIVYQGDSYDIFLAEK